MVFQNRMCHLFAVIPPTIGSIINVGDRMIIDKIEYKDEQIILWVTDYFNIEDGRVIPEDDM